MLLDKHKWGTATKGLLGNSEYVVASMAGFKHIMEYALGQQEAQEVSDCSLKAAMRFLDRMESRSKGQIPTLPHLAPAYEARRLRFKDRHPGPSLLKKVFTQSPQLMMGATGQVPFQHVQVQDADGVANHRMEVTQKFLTFGKH